MRGHGVLFTALIALVLGACTVSNGPAASSGPLRIGVLIPFTESAIDGDEGASQRRAADLYLKLHGGKLGGRDAVLVYSDESVLSPDLNRTKIQHFLVEDHVDLLLGGLGDAAAAALRDAADTAKVVYIDTNAAVNELTRTASPCSPTCRSDYVFRGGLDAWQMSEPLGEWAAKSGQRDAYLVYEDDAYGSESAAAFAEGLAKGGGRVAAKASVAPKSGADWTKVVAAIGAQSAKAVFAAFTTEDAEGFLKAWGSAGLAGAGYHLFGPGPLTDAQVLKVAKQGAVGTTTGFLWSTTLSNAENAGFIDAFAKAYIDEDTGRPEVPDGYAAEMWSVMSALDEALRASHGDGSARALVPALAAVKVKTAVGELSFDATTHSAIADVYIREVRATGPTLVNAVVDSVPKVDDAVR